MDNGTKTSLVIGGNSNSGAHSQPFDLAIDIIGRLLFWTCSHANTINITRWVNLENCQLRKNYLIFHIFSLDTYEAIGVVDQGKSEKPRSIAVHPIRRLLFWTDVGSLQAVVRAKMDGSNRLVIASNLAGVTTLALDPISNLIFFAHSSKIEFMDINGKNRWV